MDTSVGVLVVLVGAAIGAAVGWLYEINNGKKWIRYVRQETASAFTENGVLFLISDREDVILGHLEVYPDRADPYSSDPFEHARYLHQFQYLPSPERCTDRVHESDFDLDRRTIGLWEYPFVRTYHPRYHGESVSIRGDTTEIAAWLRDSSTKAGHMSQLAINTFETRVMDRYRVKAGAAAFVYLFVGAFIVWLVAGLISSYI